MENYIHFIIIIIIYFVFLTTIFINYILQTLTYSYIFINRLFARGQLLLSLEIFFFNILPIEDKNLQISTELF